MLDTHENVMRLWGQIQLRSSNGTRSQYYHSNYIIVTAISSLWFPLEEEEDECIGTFFGGGGGGGGGVSIRNIWPEVAKRALNGLQM